MEPAGAVWHPAGADVAELIVLGPLLLVGEDFVGGGDVLELGLGRLVAGVAVGMVLPGELAVRLGDFVGRGGTADAERRRTGLAAWRSCGSGVQSSVRGRLYWTALFAGRFAMRFDAQVGGSDSISFGQTVPVRWHPTDACSGRKQHIVAVISPQEVFVALGGDQLAGQFGE